MINNVTNLNERILLVLKSLKADVNWITEKKLKSELSDIDPAVIDLLIEDLCDSSLIIERMNDDGLFPTNEFEYMLGSNAIEYFNRLKNSKDIKSNKNRSIIAITISALSLLVSILSLIVSICK